VAVVEELSVALTSSLEDIIVGYELIPSE